MPQSRYALRHRDKSPDSKWIVDGLKTLPRELRDQILHYLFIKICPRSADPKHPDPREPYVVKIHCRYKPPLALQIDRQMRASYAEKYYGFDWRVWTADLEPYFTSWKSFLPIEHREMVDRGRFVLAHERSPAKRMHMTVGLRRLISSVSQEHTTPTPKQLHDMGWLREEASSMAGGLA